MSDAVSPSPDVPVHPTAIPAVQTWELTKTYRTGFWLNQKLTSLQNCSLTVNQGETFGLLGPNGAGKTTLLKMLLGITRPSVGRAVIMGRPIGDRQVKQHLGYLPENAYLYDYLTAWEFLQFTAGLFQLPRSLTQKRIPELLDLVGLSQKTAKKKQLRQYSKGMMQRVGMAQALINDPDLVFFDEPMSGLDPTGRYQVREMILQLKQQGKTIFFNSHILTDVEQICDRIAILARGELVAVGSLQELLGSDETYQVQVRGGDPTVLRRWLPDLYNQNQCWCGQLQGQPADFLRSLDLMEAQLVDLKLMRTSLEEFFITKIREKGITFSE